MRDRLVVNTFPYIWTHGIEECLDHLAAQGRRRVEILLTEPHCWPTSLDAGVRRRVGERVRAGMIEIVSLNPGGFDNNLASPAREVRDLAVRYLSSVLDLAAEWSASGIVMSPGVGRPLLPPPAPLIDGWFQTSVEQLLPRAERTQVDLLLENIPFTFLRTADALAAVAERLRHPRLAIVYDAANAIFVRERPEDGLRRVRQHLRLVHFSDTGFDAWRHDRIGRGVVPFERCLATMREIEYSGPLVLEIIDPDADAAISESIAKVEAMFRKE